MRAALLAGRGSPLPGKKKLPGGREQSDAGQLVALISIGDGVLQVPLQDLHWEHDCHTTAWQSDDLCRLKQGRKQLRQPRKDFINGVIIMELCKYKNGQILFQFRHDKRELPDEKMPGNEAIVPELKNRNYDLVKRGETAKEINAYRKEVEKEIFFYNRKDIVHDIEFVISCPSDCPESQKDAFFEAAVDYISSIMPLGRRAICTATVHRDEKHKVTGQNGIEYIISKDHIHIHAIPAVPDGKHKDKNGNVYQWRLCADQLTKKKQLALLHPQFQKFLDDRGIKATVYKKKEGDGKTIGLSTKQLKEISRKTGVVLDHSLTVNELTQIISTSILNEKQTAVLKSQIAEKDFQIKGLEKSVSSQKVSVESVVKGKDTEIKNLQNRISDLEKNNASLEDQSAKKDLEITSLKSQIKSKDQELIVRENQLADKDREISRNHQNAVNSARLENELHEKDSQIIDLKHEISTLTEKTEILEGMIQQKDAEIRDIKASDRTEELGNKINDLECRVQSKDEEIASLRGKNTELENNISQLTEKISHSVADTNVEHSAWGNSEEVEWGSGSSAWGNNENIKDKDVTW